MSDKHNGRETYQSKSVCIGVLVDVFPHVPVRDPIRNELRGIESDTQEGQDVWVRQLFPYDGLLTEGLRGLLVVANRGSGGVNNSLWYSFADHSKGPLVYVWHRPSNH